MQNLVLITNRFFDVLWWPLSRTPAYVDIIIISAISAWVFLVIFKKTSNQEMIRLYKNKIFAHILEIRLYKDRPILTIKIIFNILRYNIVYLKYTLIPLIAILPIVLIISVQLNNRYGYSPIAPGQRFIIRVDLDKTAVPDIDSSLKKIRLSASKGILIETSPMRIVSEASKFWRAKVINAAGGQQYCTIAIDGTGQAVEKKIFTAVTTQRFSPKRKKWHTRSLLVSNAEDFIPQTSPFESVNISYKRATYPILAWNTDSIILYFILTIIFGLLFKPMIGVNI